MTAMGFPRCSIRKSATGRSRLAVHSLLRREVHDENLPAEDLNVYEGLYWILTALSVALMVGAVVFLMLVLSEY